MSKSFNAVLKKAISQKNWFLDHLLITLNQIKTNPLFSFNQTYNKACEFDLVPHYKLNRKSLTLLLVILKSKKLKKNLNKISNSEINNKT